MSLENYNYEKMLADEQSEKSKLSDCIIKDNIIIGETDTGSEDLNVERIILRSFDENPDFIGMIDAETDEKVTFSQMKDRSIRCALWLRKQGIEENDFVGISTPNQISDYVPFLATLYVNAVINPWYYNSTEENWRHCFDTCPPKIMFACGQSIDKLSSIAKEKGIDCKFVAFKQHSEHVSLEEILAEQTFEEVDNFECTIPSDPKKKLSIIIWSSGTTNIPKAIMLPYSALMVYQLKESGLERDMVCVHYTAFAWLAYGFYTSGAIRLRCTRIVQEHFDTELSASIVDKYKVNFIFMRPYLLCQWERAKVWRRYDFSHLRTITLAGTKANKVSLKNCLMDLPNAFIRNIYGASEAGGSITKKIPSCKHIDSVGFVRCGVQMKVVDPSCGNLLGPNQQGEIYIRTNSRMLGYYHNEEESKRSIDDDRWLRTGDLGYYDEDGEIMICDRLKAMIKTKFHTLSPNEVEGVLLRHPAVKDCAVVAVDHPIDIERPFMFIVKEQDAQVTEDELIGLAATVHEFYRLTSRVAFVDELPYTNSGKKCLMKLLQMAKSYSS